LDGPAINGKRQSVILPDLTERSGKLARPKLELVLSGIDVVLGR
jgi:hypothetical protein